MAAREEAGERLLTAKPAGQGCELLGSERCSTAAAARSRPLCLPPRLRPGHSGRRRAVGQNATDPAKASRGLPPARPWPRLSPAACHLIPAPGPASTTPLQLRPVSPASSPRPALKPEVRAGHSGHPRRMRDGTSGASSALRGGSERVGASERRALPARGARPRGGSPRGGLRGFWASDSVGRAWAPAEALKQEGGKPRDSEAAHKNDSRTALGAEWVPRVHFHLEQAEWPAGTEGGGSEAGTLVQLSRSGGVGPGGTPADCAREPWQTGGRPDVALPSAAGNPALRSPIPG